MRVAIFDKIIRHNIELFKKLVLKQMMKQEKLQQTASKTYAAFINRKTGEIRFADLEKEKASSSGSEWKAINVRVRIPEFIEEGIIEIIDGDREENSFFTQDLDPLAYRALAETIKTLNVLARPSAKLKNVERIFQELSELEIEPSFEKREKKDLIHESWHQVDRLGAETLLSGLPVGTFLFRKDEAAIALEAQLNALRRRPIKCVTLTFSEWEDKFTDKTIVFTDDGCLFYNDDLTLSGTTYPTISALLETMDDFLARPLYHD